jgi:hypothetical protein
MLARVRLNKDRDNVKVDVVTTHKLGDIGVPYIVFDVQDGLVAVWIWLHEVLPSHQYLKEMYLYICEWIHSNANVSTVS